MSVRRSSSFGWSSAAAALSWRSVPQRFSFILFMVLALSLLVWSRMQPEAITIVRSHTVDALAPVLDALARPTMAIQDLGHAVHNIVALKAENQRLREENAHLIEWQNVTVALGKENRELRELLKFKAEPKVTFISARVIADTGGAYSRGLIVTAGKADGVREGMAAMTGEGLIGRVVEVGEWSSRIWLISDLNSRIPVSVAETGDRAILAGDNSSEPQLLFLARDAVIPDEAHVLTSGHGGVFPPNLPVGVLHQTGRGTYSVIPNADLGRITYVRLVDFNLEGGAFNPVDAKIRAESKKR